MINKVLVVDDDEILQKTVQQALEFHNFNVKTASNGKEALEATYKEKFDLVVMDVNMPEMDGITALSEMKNNDPSIIVIMLTAFSNVGDAVKCVKEGAFNYLEKPISANHLVSLIKRALKARSLVETTAFSAPTLTLGNTDSDDKFVGESEPMKKVFGIIGKLAKVKTPVLIRGESGTGKELVAKAIHYNGPRKDNRFVVINCAAIPDTLIESELFGHEKGAFTGADSRKIGKFQYADGGTLFLDEIGDVSQATQVKLLRVLQEQKFTPVGSNREVTTDVRVIAASHKPFEEMIKDGSFREDLFYRLNVLPVYLPPLRERKSDIPHLIDYYMNHFNTVHGLEISDVDPEAKKILVDYHWPGNIRELRNVIEHSFIIESSNSIRSSSFPAHMFNKKVMSEEVQEQSEELPIDYDEIKTSVWAEESNEKSPYQFDFAVKDDDGNIALDFQEAKDQFEKQFIEEALKMNKGKINKTALNANIPKKTLLRKIEKYGINPKSYYEK